MDLGTLLKSLYTLPFLPCKETTICQQHPETQATYLGSSEMVCGNLISPVPFQISLLWKSKAAIYQIQEEEGR